MSAFYSSLFADDASRLIAAGCFVLTVALYFASKALYARFRSPWLTPLLAVPAVLAAIVVVARIPYAVYFQDTRWLMWLLGPATVAFAVPIYEYRELLKRHWISLTVGVTVGILVAGGGSPAAGEPPHLAPELHRSRATRPVHTPFAARLLHQTHPPQD